ncbi:hypothetical protein E2C01_087749 [Portunus trituberculatus]|uniref:Uncharacterized protein n=1 Tax=Portunus trituberculatus TaxID=210409 RepID=A0A5B7JCH3_PORTR|nr:hypothetical protein [Portunus trituberculatus]
MLVELSRDTKRDPSLVSRWSSGWSLPPVTRRSFPSHSLPLPTSDPPPHIPARRAHHVLPPGRTLTASRPSALCCSQHQGGTRNVAPHPVSLARPETRQPERPEFNGR